MNRAHLAALALFGFISLSQVAGQLPVTSSLRNSSTLPLASSTVVISPWDNHHQYAPIIVPINTTLSFLWSNDDHGVWLLNNDQCPLNFTDGANGQEELYPVTSKTGGEANYTTTLAVPGIYYFTCQQGIHCSQGQRLEVTVYDYEQGIPGTLTQYPPSANTNLAPAESHVVPSTPATTASTG